MKKLCITATLVLGLFVSQAAVSATKKENCPQVPAGAIVLGNYCPQIPEEIPTPTTVAQAGNATEQVKTPDAKPSQPEAEAPQQSAVAAQVSQTPPTTALASLPTPLASPPATLPAITVLEIKAGQRLNPSLKAWLGLQSIELHWEAWGAAPGTTRDIVLSQTYIAYGAGLDETLAELLEPFGLQAKVQKANNKTHVLVRNAAPYQP